MNYKQYVHLFSAIMRAHVGVFFMFSGLIHEGEIVYFPQNCAARLSLIDYQH